MAQYATLGQRGQLHQRGNPAQTMSWKKLPAGPAATAAGWQAVDSWERVNNWAKANLAATRLLQKSPPYRQVLRVLELHRGRMGEKVYARVGQRANAIESFRKAKDVAVPAARPTLYVRLISELHPAPIPSRRPSSLQVAEYLQKFSRPAMTVTAIRTLACRCLQCRRRQGCKAEQILAEVLPFDARSHNAIGHLPQPGSPPSRIAPPRPSKVLRDAIAKSTATSQCDPAPLSPGILTFTAIASRKPTRPAPWLERLPISSPVTTTTRRNLGDLVARHGRQRCRLPGGGREAAGGAQTASVLGCVSQHPARVDCR